QAIARIREGGRIDEQRCRRSWRLSHPRELLRANPQRRESSRPAGSAADQDRAGGQSQVRERLGCHCSDIDPGARRRGDRMRRREVITLIGAAAAWPLAARAQPVPVVGILSSRSATTDADLLGVVRQGLRDVGYSEGRNVAFTYRGADAYYDRLPALAAELVRERVSVIVTMGGGLTASAAKAATASIPIVFTVGADPV